MSSTRRLVSPKLPTALASDTRVDLPGYDLWFNNIDHVHVIPTKLDVSKFEDALSNVLQLYPHAAGQLRCTDGRWSIELTNTAVPVDIDRKIDVSFDSLLHGDWVVQDDLSPLLDQHPMGVNFVNSSAPLLRLKLTLFDTEACIGVSWNHTLGDAIMMLRFVHTLSQLYQDLPPEYAPPAFKKYHFPAEAPMVPELSPYVPVYRHFDLAAYLDSCKDLTHVRWRADNHDLEALRLALGSNGQNKKYLSKQDCLTAYFTAILNHGGSSPVKTVVNATSYRHISAPFIFENVASSLVVNVHTEVPTDMAGIAVAVRDSLVQCRKPDCIYTLETLKSDHMLEAANTGRIAPFGFDGDELLVNSHAVIDWCSAHFGCPDGTRFYMGGVHRRLLRCFRSNPVKGDDGIWRARQSIEISIGVPAELKPKILETLDRGVQYMLDNQCVQT